MVAIMCTVAEGSGFDSKQQQHQQQQQALATSDSTSTATTAAASTSDESSVRSASNSGVSTTGSVSQSPTADPERSALKLRALRSVAQIVKVSIYLHMLITCCMFSTSNATSL
jgi:hypothetical protein